MIALGVVTIVHEAHGRNNTHTRTESSTLPLLDGTYESGGQVQIFLRQEHQKVKARDTCHIVLSCFFFSLFACLIVCIKREKMYSKLFFQMEFYIGMIFFTLFFASSSHHSASLSGSSTFFVDKFFLVLEDVCV